MELANKDFVENVVCDPITLEEALEITNNGHTKEMADLLVSLKGSGLAAPQIGIAKKYFIAYTGDKEFKVFFNPRYVGDGSRTHTREACLTYGSENFTDCKRYKSIIAFYDDIDENHQFVHRRIKVKGVDAIVFQHETDHVGCGDNRPSRTIFMK